MRKKIKKTKFTFCCLNIQDSNFYTIFLHGLLEHLSSNTKCIKKFLIHIAKYIDNKSININKSNNIADLSSIGEVAWKFISSIYNSGWDSLLTDENNNFFRQKITSKFTPKTSPIKTGKNEEKSIDKLASIKRLPSPILAKSFKEVKEISKYFKQPNKL